MRVSDFDLFKRQFVLRQIGGYHYLIPLFDDPSIIKSLDTNAVIFWKTIKVGDNLSIASTKISEYFNIDQDTAKKDIKAFINDLSLRNANLVNETSSDITTSSTRTPLSGSFELTGKCNLHCFHCYVASERKNQDLTLPQIKKIIDDLTKNGCLFLLLTGGECTSRSDFAKIYTYVRKKGIIPSINTNATLIDKKLLTLLKKYPPKRIKVSLYGPSAEVHDRVTKVKGSFEKIIKNSILLKNLGLNVVFSGLIFKDNSHLESELKQFASTLDIPILITRGLVPTLDHHSDHLCQLDKTTVPYDQKIVSKHFDTDGTYQCDAGESSFHINSRGQLSICMMERQDLISLTSQSFLDAWDQLGTVRRSRLSIPMKCSNCSSIESCNFCPVIYNLFKSSGVLNIYCSKI